MATATIRLKYPDWKVVVRHPIAERKKFRNNFLRTKLLKLLATNYFSKYELIGSKIRPFGVKTKLPLASLIKLSGLPYIGNVQIESLQGAKKKIEKPMDKYFCIRMTVVIQVEGFSPGMQEERFVLIKANSREDAYRKVAKQAKDYAEPYLNSDSRLVTWKTKSYDDCWEPYIVDVNELNSAEGIEVYSKLRPIIKPKKKVRNGRLK